MGHDGARAPRHWALVVTCHGRWPAGRGANCCAMIHARARDVAAEHALCAARNFFVVAAAGLPPLRRSSGDVVTAAGLSRAAREVFGPICDIGPVLIDFEILRFLGLELF
ncbi:hypothetical protein F511_46462 [Dorcoceras hygrometricum]|uniref:Uncharacterized protein n=1 Tax=Dorcoceras hygrometricum TaxID=472368 RepID=A0A2Z7A0D1_9LAMI|nr:hypothetical protein F511_46462 [Dorcoceras hygrometricum]